MNNLITTLNSKFSHSSLAIRYLQKFVEEETYKPNLIEFTINQHVDDIVREIYEGNYDVIAFSCYIWNYEMILKIAEDLKTVSPEKKIIFGGPEVSYRPNEIMEKYKFVDYIISGEGEITYKELCEYIFLSKGKLCEIDGITYKDESVIENKPRALITDLDIVPFPYSDLIELENRKIYYESSRGCPFNCQYCLSSMTGRVRSFSIERVKKDLQFFIDKEVEQIKFVDRTFNADPKRALEIFKYLHENDNGVTNFHLEMVASLLDEETLEFLSTVRIGLFQFEIGVQTTNTDTIAAIKRNIEFVKISDRVKKLSEFKNIHLHLDLIAGLPHENYESFLNSFEDVYALRPEKLQLGFLKLLKGSGLRVNANEYGYIYSKQAPYEIFKNDYISFDELIKLKYLEEILEMYYNSGRFRNSLEMIIKNYYDRAVDFYIDFSMYWKENNLFDQPHKQIKLYQILKDYYEFRAFENLEGFSDIVKHDYFLNNQKAPFGVFNIENSKDFTNSCYDFVKDSGEIENMLEDTESVSPKALLKRLKFITYDYDVFKIISSDFKEVVKNNMIIMYDYHIEYKVFDKSKSIDITNYIKKRSD